MSSKKTLLKKELLGLYRTMQTIRKTEEQLVKSHQRGLIPGACHTYIGEEAVASGVCANLTKKDAVFSTHRGHGHALAKGMDPELLIAELFGRETGCSRGRGGSMHLFSPEIGMMGTSGIVAPCILQAVGAGYSFKLMKEKHVGVCFFGDGASNNGAFAEGLNLASIYKLPVLFVCENNQFATEISINYSAGNPNIYERAAAFGIPGIQVDGNDVLAVEAAARDAVNRARSGEGPTLIECKTYRTRGHAEGMGEFRTKEELEEWKSKCPIKRFREHLLSEKLVAKKDLDEVDNELDAQIADAQQSAEAAAYPDPSTATTHVYHEAEAAPLRDAPDTNADTRNISFMKATLEALSEEMAGNPKIFVLGEGVGPRGGNFATTQGLYGTYGQVRLCDTPICERGFVGLSCGAAMTGTRPVVDFMFADFVLDAAGEIINQIAKMQYMSSGRLKMPILMRGCIGIGHSAATHHSGSYYAMYANFPGLRVVVPSTPKDAKGLMKTALTCNDPVIFLEHRELMAIKGPVPEEEYFIDFGKASVVREGTDVTVVALALMVHKTLEACEKLAAEGLSVELIDPRTVSPLDTETIRQSVAKTGRLLIVDESFSLCGVGAEIAAQLADIGFDDLDAPIRRLNGADSPTPYSPSLERAVVPSPEIIAQAIRDLCEA